MNGSTGKPPKVERKKSSPFRVVVTPDGSRIGELQGDASAGKGELRLEDGSVLPVPQGVRLATVADPSLLPPIAYEHGVTGSPSDDLAAIVEGVRSELQNPDERRAWVARMTRTELPQGREVDELIRYRYEQHRAAILVSLQSFLETRVEAGDQRGLLSCLETDAPGDVRRAAMQVAARRGVAAAIPLVCGAAIHRTQRQLALEALRALQLLAPERLPLVHAESAEEVRAETTAEAAHALPEWSIVQRVQAKARTDAEEPTGPQDEKPDWTRVMHLAFGASLEQQNDLLERLPPDDEGGRAVRNAAADLLRVLGGRESPTTYEALLRQSAARFILADSHAGADREVRHSAARLLARDSEGPRLEEVFLALPEQSAELLLRTALDNPRSQAAKRLLIRAAEDRREIGPQLGRALLEVLRAHELEGAQHASALVLALESPDARDRAGDLAARQLGRHDARSNEMLAGAIARSGVLPNLQLAGSQGRIALLSILDTVDPDRAAELLARLGLPAAPDQAEQEARRLRLPDAWPATSPSLRRVMVPWTSAFAAAGPSAMAHGAIVEAAAGEAAISWLKWDSPTRRSVLKLIASAAPNEALKYLARIAGTLPAESGERREVLLTALRDHLPNAPASITALLDAFPEEELRSLLIQEAASVRNRIDEARRRQGDNQRAETLELATELRAAATSAIRAIGREDQLGVLLARLELVLGEHIASASIQTDASVAEYHSEYGENADKGQPMSALQSALRGSVAKATGTASSIGFFRAEVRRLLVGMSVEEISGFVTANRRMLERIDLTATEPIVAALIAAGGDVREASKLLSGPRQSRAAINVALALTPEHLAAALRLLTTAQVSPSEIAALLAQLTMELHEAAGSPDRHDTLSGLARDVAETFDALDGLIIHVARLRRLMAKHGLVPVEPVLGAIQPFEALHPAHHRVVGRAAEDGPHEVISLGLRRVDEGSVLVPATVARLASTDSTGA